MPAETLHPLLPARQKAVQLDARQAAPRARGAVALDRQEHGRAVQLLGDPPGRHAHHPLVPVRAPGHQDRRQRRPRAKLPSRILHHPHLLDLPVAVPAVELGGQLAGALRIAAHQQLQRPLRAVQASRRIDPRPEPEAHVGGGKRRLDARPLDERLQAVGARLRQRLQAESGDDPVLPAQRHQVGDSAEAGDPQQGRQVHGTAAAPGDRDAQLERQADRRQVGERIGAARLAGVDVQRPGRQLTAGQMMVGHHHVDAHRLGPFDRRRRRAAAVRGDDQGTAEVAGAVGVDRLKAIAFAQPVRQDRQHVAAAGSEHGEQQGRGGDAVDVVVADHRDLLAPVACLNEALDDRLHAGEQKGIVKLVQGRLEEAVGAGPVHHPAAGQQSRHPARDSGPLDRGDGVRHRSGYPLRGHRAVTPRRRPRGPGTCRSGGRRALPETGGEAPREPSPARPPPGGTSPRGRCAHRRGARE